MSTCGVVVVIYLHLKQNLIHLMVISILSFLLSKFLKKGKYLEILPYDLLNNFDLTVLFEHEETFTCLLHNTSQLSWLLAI